MKEEDEDFQEIDDFHDFESILHDKLIDNKRVNQLLSKKPKFKQLVKESTERQQIEKEKKDLLDSHQKELRVLVLENEELIDQDQNHEKEIKLMKSEIETQTNINRLFNDRLTNKREDFKGYMEHLEQKKRQEEKKLSILENSLHKNKNMQRELAVLLKLTNQNLNNGVEFINFLKEMEVDHTMNDLMEQLGIYPPEEDIVRDKKVNETEDKEANKQTNEEKSEVTLREIRDILLNINKRKIANM